MAEPLGMPRVEPQVWISVLGLVTLAVGMLAALLVLR